MTTKVGIYRKWMEAVPKGRDDRPIPARLWPQRRRHTWVVRWFAVEANGRASRPSKQFDTRQDAETFAAELQDQLNKAPSLRRNVETVTIRRFIERFRELRIGPRGERLKISSLTSSDYALRKFGKAVGDGRELASLTEMDAVTFFNKVRESGLSDASVNKLKRTLKAAFNVAIKPCRFLRENPFADIKCDRTSASSKRYVTPAEYAALVAACDEVPASQKAWWKAFLAVAYTGGLRFNEIVHLTLADVDIKASVIHIRGKAATSKLLEWSTKSYENRSIPVPAGTISTILPLHEACPEGHSYIFIPPDRLRLILAAQRAGTWKEGQAVLNNVRRSFQVLVLKAAEATLSLRHREGRGYQPDVSIHDLRRSAITNWSKVVNPQTLQTLAGHVDIKTTMQFYAQTTNDQLEKAREASIAATSEVKSASTDPKVTPRVAKAGKKPAF